MKKFIWILFPLILSFVFILGCKDSVTPTQTGDLEGFAYLVDINENQLQTDNSGISVTTEGSGISAITDQSGHFVLSGLKQGYCNIISSKQGYGFVKETGWQVVGGVKKNVSSRYLGRIPEYTVTDLTAFDSLGRIYLKGHFTGILNSSMNCLLFISTASNVSSNPQDYICWSGILQTANVIFETSLDPADYYLFGKNNLHSGQNIYIIAYAMAPAGIPYTDNVTGRYVYTNLNQTPSNIVSVVIP